MGVYQSSGVRFSELDLSQVVSSASTTIGAIVIAAKQGEVGVRQFFSDFGSFTREYGNADPTVGYGHYAAQAFLAQGNQLWVTRAIGSGYTYGGAAVGSALNSSTGLVGTVINNYPTANPAAFDFTQTGLFPPAVTNNFMFISASGPGSYAKNVSTSITSNNLQTPTLLTYQPVSKFTAVISASVPTQVVTANTSVSVKGTISNASNITLDATTGLPTGTTAIYDAGGTVAVGDKVVLFNMSVPAANGQYVVTSSGIWTESGAANTLFIITGNGLNVFYQADPVSNTWANYTYAVDASDPQVLVAGTSTVLLTGQNDVTQTGLYTIGANGLLAKVAIDASGTVTDNTKLISAGHVFRFVWNGYSYVRDWNYLGAATTNPISGKYLITAVNGSGESLASNSITATAPGVADKTGSYSLLTDTFVWPNVTGAVSYNIYLKTGTTGTLADYHFLDNTNLLTYTNYGLSPLSGAATPPTKYVGTNSFVLNVFDLTQNPTVPVEAWSVTLLPGVDGLGNQTEVSAVINDPSVGSNYINVTNNYANASASTVVPLLYTTTQTALSGGSSGTAVTSNDVVTAWGLFTDKEQVQVTLLINGGFSTPVVQLTMDAIAQKRMDCMAILDLPTSYQTPAAALNYRNNILNLNSNYSAIYGPDLLIGDTVNSIQIYVPPSGHVAGVYAYNDSVSNVWFAPAGLNRGQLSILGVRQIYNDGDRELLSGAQVNYVRKLPGIGYAVMEAWTMQSKRSALSFVPVRRLLITVETSLSNALLYSLWEPNDPVLRMQIVTMISDYLTIIQNGRGLNQFLVVCDDTNNPSTDTANGILHVDVYMEPTLPVQQIAARAIITQQNASFSEAVKLANS